MNNTSSRVSSLDVDTKVDDFLAEINALTSGSPDDDDAAACAARGAHANVDVKSDEIDSTVSSCATNSSCWYQCVDEASGYTYFYNSDTRESSWDTPETFHPYVLQLPTEPRKRPRPLVEYLTEFVQKNSDSSSSDNDAEEEEAEARHRKLKKRRRLRQSCESSDNNGDLETLSGTCVGRFNKSSSSSGSKNLEFIGPQLPSTSPSLSSVASCLPPSADDCVAAVAETAEAVERQLRESILTRMKEVEDKLSFLEVSVERFGMLERLLLEIRTRLADWEAGGLSTALMARRLHEALTQLARYEEQAVPRGWECRWNQEEHRYFYIHLITQETQWDYPQVHSDDDSLESDQEAENISPPQFPSQPTQSLVAYDFDDAHDSSASSSRCTSPTSTESPFPPLPPPLPAMPPLPPLPPMPPLPPLPPMPTRPPMPPLPPNRNATSTLRLNNATSLLTNSTAEMSNVALEEDMDMDSDYDPTDLPVIQNVSESDVTSFCPEQINSSFHCNAVVDETSVAALAFVRSLETIEEYSAEPAAVPIATERESISSEEEGLLSDHSVPSTVSSDTVDAADAAKKKSRDTKGLSKRSKDAFSKNKDLTSLVKRWKQVQNTL